MRSLMFILGGIGILLAACAAPATETIIVTATPEPTATNVPATATPVSTDTPEPTPEPTALPGIYGMSCGEAVNTMTANGFELSEYEEGFFAVHLEDEQTTFMVDCRQGFVMAAAGVTLTVQVYSDTVLQFFLQSGLPASTLTEINSWAIDGGGGPTQFGEFIAVTNTTDAGRTLLAIAHNSVPDPDFDN